MSVNTYHSLAVKVPFHLHVHYGQSVVSFNKWCSKTVGSKPVILKCILLTPWRWGWHIGPTESPGGSGGEAVWTAQTQQPQFGSQSQLISVGSDLYWPRLPCIRKSALKYGSKQPPWLPWHGDAFSQQWIGIGPYVKLRSPRHPN